MGEFPITQALRVCSRPQFAGQRYRVRRLVVPEEGIVLYSCHRVSYAEQIHTDVGLVRNEIGSFDFYRW